MQRFPPFDPPEYVNWKPDAALVKAYRATIEADSERAAVVSALSPDAKLALYAGLLRARLHDIQLQRWVRTGVISKAWLGTGEEWPTVAAVQRVPAIFIPQNNPVALGTRLDQHHLPGDFREWPAQYGVWGAQFDGNNVLDAYAAARLAAARCRDGQGPAMLVAETFRMGGHATHDEREARETLPAEMFQAWGKRDPVGLYEEYLKEEGRTAQQLGEVEAAVTAQVERAAEEALASREKMPPGESAVVGVYAKQGRQ